MKSILPESLQPMFSDLRHLAIQIVIAIFILTVGWLISKFFGRWTTKLIEKNHVNESIANFIGNLVRYVLLAATVISSLGTVGIQTTSLIAVFGAAGFAVGMALQGSLSHFASGVMILFFRPFTIGDSVQISDVTGTVKDIGMFFTTVHTFDGHKVIIPNGKIIQDTITNITAQGQRRGNVVVGVAYGTDIKRAQSAIQKAVESVDLVLSDPAPVIRLTEFAASSINLKTFLWATTNDYGAMLHEAHIAIYNELNAQGIEIPFDQIVVHSSKED